MGNVVRLTEAIFKDSGADIGWVGTLLNDYVMGITLQCNIQLDSLFKLS
jgi:hypothetical protein